MDLRNKTIKNKPFVLLFYNVLRTIESLNRIAFCCVFSLSLSHSLFILFFSSLVALLELNTIIKNQKKKHGIICFISIEIEQFCSVVNYNRVDCVARYVNIEFSDFGWWSAHKLIYSGVYVHAIRSFFFFIILTDSLYLINYNENGR